MTSEMTTHRAFGVVLDPIQFAAELASLKQRPQYRGRALYISLPDAVARLFESPVVPIMHSLAISGGAALQVAVAIFQAAGTQVVCLVPLSTEEARDWLIESVEKQKRIFVAVTIDECKQMVVIQAEPPVHGSTAGEWLAVKDRLSGWRSVDRVAEAMDVLEVLRYIDNVPESAVAGVAVQERWIFVCVPHHQDGVGAASEVNGEAAAVVH